MTYDYNKDPLTSLCYRIADVLETTVHAAEGAGVEFSFVRKIEFLDGLTMEADFTAYTSYVTVGFPLSGGVVIDVSLGTGKARTIAFSLVLLVEKVKIGEESSVWTMMMAVLEPNSFTTNMADAFQDCTEVGGALALIAEAVQALYVFDEAKKKWALHKLTTPVEEQVLEPA